MKKNKILTRAAMFLTAVCLIFMYSVIQNNKKSNVHEIWYSEYGEILGYTITFEHKNETIYYFIDSDDIENYEE